MASSGQIVSLGRDRDLPRLTSSDSSAVSPIKIFLSDILSPESAHVNIHVQDDKPRLHVFHLQKQKISPVRYILTEIVSHPAAFASPIICTRPAIQDVIITDPASMQLSIVTSHGQVCAITAPSALDGHYSLAGIRVLDATDSKITAQLPGGPLLRLDLDLNVRHPLTQQCLSALACVLDAKEFFSVKLATLAYYRQKSQDWTFKDFGHVLLSVLGVLNSPGTAPAEINQDPWQTLLDDIAEHRELHLENALLDESARSKGTLLSDDAICPQNLTDNCVPYIIQALHVTAEEKRLIANRERDVLSLANLIVSLASHYQLHAWVDYWLRSAPSTQNCLTARAIREYSLYVY